jgi:AraC family transcriptional regulator of adaptative response/methylated-DNA-[protein]-cysteine methyltransferase
MAFRINRTHCPTDLTVAFVQTQALRKNRVAPLAPVAQNRRMPKRINLRTAARDYARIEQAIRFLDARFQDQPELAEVARAVGLSDYHFQRLFRRWAGVSPKRFLQVLTAAHARDLLRRQSVLDSAHASGLSGPGRLHDLTVQIYAATPGELRHGGDGLEIRYGFHATPFGECLLALTTRGVCALRFVDSSGRAGALRELQDDWPQARLRVAPAETVRVVQRLFGHSGRGAPLTLHVAGTNFQVRVWEALLRIPSGAVTSYEDLAALAGRPNAARAVGSAMARNPVALLIPCHRVIRKTGAFGEYRWGEARKRLVLGWEATRALPVDSARKP